MPTSVTPNAAMEQRIRLFYFAVMVGFMIVAGRCAYLQFYENTKLKDIAARQQKKIVSIAGKRGTITDRNGHKLALDVRAYSIYVDPEYVEGSPREMATQLSPVLAIPVDKLEPLVAGKSWRYLKRKVDEGVMKQVKDLRLKGIGIITENRRVYPHDRLGASLIGFTNIDNQGLEGIEKSFDAYLQGGTEKVSILTDAHGNELLRTDGDLPFLTEKSKSNKVVLTIDENVQYLAERELQKGMDATKADRGVAIVMGLENGDLLALATNPVANPNEIATAGWSPHIKNWAVTDFYEPGSTMKIFTIAAALDAGKTSPDEVIACPTLIHVDRWPVHDHHQPPGRVRNLRPIEILEVSSNTGSSILGRRMSAEQHRSILQRFGFGTATHSGLNGEVGGILPKLPWAASRQSTVSFGQGIAVTPLQIVTAASAMVNRGIRVEPRIIDQIVSPEGKVIKAFPPIKSRTLSESSANATLGMMQQVVESPKGTAHSAKIPGYVMGGKTGTADKVVNGRYNGDVMSSFVGVLPADNPKFVIFVLFDAPKTAHYASMTAVPVYKEIARNLITYYGLQPSRPDELKDYALAPAASVALPSQLPSPINP